MNTKIPATTEQIYSAFKQHPEVCTDTRAIRESCIFFALKGGNFNGNTFAAQAIEKGAAYVVIDEAEYFIEGKTFLVADVLTALQELAKHHRSELGKKGLIVFGLTGSNGKTTTKELLARVLAKKFNTLYTEGNLNNHIGVPLTLLRLKEEHQMAVIEMGANHQKEIELLSSIADPDYGLITNVGLAHLEGFGGPEGVLKGKTELFVHLRNKNAKALVLADDPRVIQISEGMKRMGYGTTKEAEVYGRLISSDPFVKFEWKTMDIPLHEVQTQMAGSYNLTNLIAACAVGVEFGISSSDIDEAIASYKPSNARSQLEQRDSNTMILDYYNANPSSMAAAIDNLARLTAEKKIIVLGDMFELGDLAVQEHQRIADLVSEKLKGATVVLVGKLFSQVKGYPEMIRLNDGIAAAEWMKQQQPENCLILIKGSRGMKMEIILAD
jgi:UDP-N-acetylmuramoyl-tripeptide--D-alanyl-D-alanine ligase